METGTSNQDSLAVADHPQQATASETNLKRCPFCAEQIQAQAVKCRYCHEFLNGAVPARPRPRTGKWYHSTAVVIMALLCLGPLALPLVWINPRYKILTKAIVTVAVFAFTIACTYLLGALYRQFLNQFSALGI